MASIINKATLAGLISTIHIYSQINNTLGRQKNNLPIYGSFSKRQRAAPILSHPDYSLMTAAD